MEWIVYLALEKDYPAPGEINIEGIKVRVNYKTNMFSATRRVIHMSKGKPKSSQTLERVVVTYNSVAEFIVLFEHFKR